MTGLGSNLQTSVPAIPIANPISASLRAGASFVPSPVTENDKSHSKSNGSYLAIMYKSFAHVKTGGVLEMTNLIHRSRKQLWRICQVKFIMRYEKHLNRRRSSTSSTWLTRISLKIVCGEFPCFGNNLLYILSSCFVKH
ncbi:uncharacterized protein LOC129903061 [Solanum dulcamara]|uniref:uncharacterized protein LOC129903061 n=1 Tax=Solanum dulcamara TaxID=45834 RepID=UPI0024859CA0|nr:uncharacterized protein LOC129903061 [Solanum dulcamara]